MGELDRIKPDKRIDGDGYELVKSRCVDTSTWGQA